LKRAEKEFMVEHRKLYKGKAKKTATMGDMKKLEPLEQNITDNKQKVAALLCLIMA
jgi:hypothetical protein